MLKERDRQVPTATVGEMAPPQSSRPEIASARPVLIFLEPVRGAGDWETAVAAMDPLDRDRMATMTEQDMERSERFSVALIAAMDGILSPEDLAKDLIKRMAGLRCETLQGQTTLVSHCVSFSAEAAECISRGDFDRLSRAREVFARSAREAAAMAPAGSRPNLTPGTDDFSLAGWKTEEYWALREILLNALCGVQKGDCCVSIDAKGARLSSGKFLSREEIAKHVQPIKHTMLAVGSLPQVLNVIRRAQ